MKKLLFILGLSFLLGMGSCKTTTVITSERPAVGYVWIQPEWRWDLVSKTWIYVPGKWVYKPDHVWHHGKWHLQHGNWHWKEGHWEPLKVR